MRIKLYKRFTDSNL